MKKNLREQEQFRNYLLTVTDEGQLLYVGKLLQRAAQLWPDQTALLYQERSYTFAHLYAQACAITHLLATQALTPTSIIIVLIENSPAFYAAYWGALQTGAVVAPLNLFLQKAEIEGIVADAQPVCIIASRSQEEKLVGLQHIRIILLDDAVVTTSENSDSSLIIPAKSSDELAVLLYSSGTTGRPKGIMLSSKNILTNVMQSTVRFNTDPKGAVLCALPLFHSFMQVVGVWGACIHGATVILVHKIDRRQLTQALQHKPQLFVGVPILYGLLCKLRNFSFPAVRYFISGGDALPDKIKLYFALIYRRMIANGYGLTESSPVVALDVDDAISAPNTVGAPLVGTECQLRSTDDTVITHGIGTLFIKSDAIMLGYYKAPELTASVLQDGWLNTGDLAYFDADKKLVIVGRSKDLIICKGMNVYPQEIENILLTHPAIFQAAVVGIKGEDDASQTVVAFVASRSLNTSLEAELIDLCHEKLAAYKAPRRIILLNELPLTATGKVDKKLLIATHLI